MTNAFIPAAILALGFASQDARAAAPTGAVVSTGTAAGAGKTAAAPTVGSVYTVDRLRDPFARGNAGRVASRPFTMEDFSIHKLSLRGIMKDASSDFALFSDNELGVSFLLRKGRLYDSKKKIIPGVSGTINMKEKMATLTAPEGDVQVFRLGEEEKE